MQTPLVSIIIPTYNRAHLIVETLDSVLAQTYTNWECIVVDDGSTDNTDMILAAYCEKDARFQYHHRPKDRLPGGNAARNYGFELSKGEYVQLFDSDDLMLPSHIFEKVNLLKENRMNEAVYCGFTYFGISVNKKNLKIINRGKYENAIEAFIQRKMMLNMPTFMFKKEALSMLKFDETLTRAQDLDFVFRFLSSKKRTIIATESLLIKIRKHSNSITGDLKKKKFVDLESEIRTRTKIIDFIESNFTNKSLILETKYYYLQGLRKALRFYYLSYFFKQLLKSKHINFDIKILLSIVALIFIITGRGLIKYNYYMYKYV